jgi:hypothetical protein
MKFRKLVVAVTLLPAALSAQAIEFGNINVTQNDNGNLATSVTLTRAPGSSPGFTVLGGNRGDYDVSFGSSDDVTGGVMLTSVSQLTRDDTATGDAAIGLFTATSTTDFVGSGYPGRLAGEQLTLNERIVAVADIMSALTGIRSYKKSFPKETVIEILQREKAAGKLCERVIDTAVQYYDIIMESGRENIRMITEMYGCISSEFRLIKKRFEEVK